MRRGNLHISKKSSIFEGTLILEDTVKNVAYGNKKNFFLAHIHFL